MSMFSFLSGMPFLPGAGKRSRGQDAPQHGGQERALNEILMTQDREHVMNLVLEMGTKARDMLARSLSILVSEEEADAHSVIEDDGVVDRLEIAINWECFSIAAMRQPVQDDLRYIFAVVRMTTDLERIGDEATNIARHLLRYRPYWDRIEDMKEVSVILNLVLEQLDDALTALKTGDFLLARRVFERDDEVDKMYDTLYDDFLNNASACENREFTRKAYVLALARHLERAGDHVTNIAESLCFALTGERITPESDPHKE
ncbi:MAG: phosphate signaling complex protein PhoU [Synergistaceae bacterium]|jgi:phosphate transport system protein|nr:phosphate signaling complex protein PhoU [Synergistaceae bacterium]